MGLKRYLQRLMCNSKLIWIRRWFDYHNAMFLVTSHECIQHPVIFCKVQLMILGYFYLHCSVYDTNTSSAVYYFFESTVIDNVNSLIINVILKHQFTMYFEKILHKLPLCTHTQLWHWLLTLAIIWRLRSNENHVRKYFVTWLRTSSQLRYCHLHNAEETWCTALFNQNMSFVNYLCPCKQNRTKINASTLKEDFEFHRKSIVIEVGGVSRNL